MKPGTRKKIVMILVFAAAFIIVCGSARAASEGEVIVFHAGSLTVPFAEMEKVFESTHPDLDIFRVSGGSTKLARMISEINKPADVMASADFAVIDKYLIPRRAEWNIRFATNQIVLCYTDQSRFGGEINADNWYRILSRKEVRWGHSEPNLDPCGYRSLMVLQLAERYYQEPGLYDRLVRNRPATNIRPKSIELVQLLRKGKLDYAWEYRSVAVQQGLRYVVLPDEINLGNYRHDDFYKKAKVRVTGRKPGTWIVHTGSSCTYGITMIQGAPNQQGALLFLEYALHPNGGLKILERMGQPPFLPCRVRTEEMRNLLPPSLRKLVEVKN